jgi:hypothetical protein
MSDRADASALLAALLAGGRGYVESELEALSASDADIRNLIAVACPHGDTDGVRLWPLPGHLDAGAIAGCLYDAVSGQQTSACLLIVTVWASSQPGGRPSRNSDRREQIVMGGVAAGGLQRAEMARLRRRPGRPPKLETWRPYGLPPLFERAAVEGLRACHRS